jgi:hypothetical protein
MTKFLSFTLHYQLQLQGPPTDDTRRLSLLADRRTDINNRIIIPVTYKKIVN